MVNVSAGIATERPSAPTADGLVQRVRVKAYLKKARGLTLIIRSTILNKVTGILRDQGRRGLQRQRVLLVRHADENRRRRWSPDYLPSCCFFPGTGAAAPERVAEAHPGGGTGMRTLKPTDRLITPEPISQVRTPRGLSQAGREFANIAIGAGPDVLSSKRC